MNQENLDQQDIRAYTTYDDPETYHNMRTASIITVTGMYINDDVYHREEGDQKGAIARFVSLTGRVFLVSPDSSWTWQSSIFPCGSIRREITRAPSSEASETRNGRTADRSTARTRCGVQCGSIPPGAAPREEV